MKESTRLRLEAIEQDEKARRTARWALARAVGRHLGLIATVFACAVLLMIGAALGGKQMQSGLLAAFLVVAALAAYLLPYGIADSRKHPAKGGILVVNLLLGWTLIGWVFALAWACSRPPPPK